MLVKLVNLFAYIKIKSYLCHIKIKGEYIMELTIEFLKNRFDQYNGLYFRGLLRKPNIVINHSRRQLGLCSRRNISIYTIKISDFYLRDEKGFVTTLLHEMIHLYIFQLGMKDSSSHGRIFKSEALRINIATELMIQPTTVLPKDIQINPKYSIKEKTKKTLRDVFIITFADKRKFVCVIASTVAYSVEYHLSGRKDILSFEHFQSDSVLYSKFIVCRTNIRGKYITNAEYDSIYSLSKVKVSSF